MPATGTRHAARASTVTQLMRSLHHTLALLGLVVALAVAALLARPAWRESVQDHAHQWLSAHQLVAQPVEPMQELAASPAAPAPTASARVTALNPQELSAEQAAVTRWISKKYRVAPEPLAALVREAWELGERHHIDPTLILAVMAIESRFNPFAQSTAGAQGLMQVMTRTHAEKYADFGGHSAAFDPLSNLRVGVRVLKECIARSGSIEGGLRHYVGAAKLPSDGGYAAKVLAEHQRLRAAAQKSPGIVTASTQPDAAS